MQNGKTKLTQAIAREYVRRLGGTVRKTDYGDYKLRIDGGEYFTDHLDDVIGTARVMAGGHPDFNEAERYLAETGASVDDSSMWRK